MRIVLGVARHRLEDARTRARIAGLWPMMPVEPVARLELRAQVGVLAAQPPLLERGGEHVQELVGLERLGDEVGGPALDRRHGVPHRAEPRHHDDDDVRIAVDRRVEDAVAADAREPEVG